MTPISIDADVAAWRSATASVNAWRRQIIECFAEAEMAVTETLVVLRGIKSRGDNMKLRHLVGQHFQDLESALAAAGPFAAKGKAALPALHSFRLHEALRPLLCHGVTKCIWIGRGGGWWLVAIKVLSLSPCAEKSGYSTITYEQ